MDELEDALRLEEVLEPVLAQVAESGPSGRRSSASSATSEESKTWPPWAAAMIRAARFTGGP